MDYSSDYGLFAYVPRLYAPGVVTAWCIGYLSVFLMWGVHPGERHWNDTITIELVAILSLPSIAACHMIINCLRLPSLADTVTDPVAQFQTLAAIDAPNAVIKLLYLGVFLVLECAFIGKHRKRLVLAMLAMFLIILADYIEVAVRFMLYDRLKDWVGTRSLYPLQMDFRSGTELSFSWKFCLFGLNIGALVYNLYRFVPTLCSSDSSIFDLFQSLPSMIVTLHIMSLVSAWAPADLEHPKVRSSDGLPRTTSSLKDMDQLVTVAGGIFMLVFAMSQAGGAIQEQKESAKDSNESVGEEVKDAKCEDSQHIDN